MIHTALECVALEIAIMIELANSSIFNYGFSSAIIE